VREGGSFGFPHLLYNKKASNFILITMYLSEKSDLEIRCQFLARNSPWFSGDF
jgi:hypothetical protein